MTKFESVFEDFQSAVERLREVLEKEKTDIVRDSAIKRFEITLDLSWKTLKAFLEVYRGVICRSPKGCMQEGFHQGLISYDELWAYMIDWRNEAVHTYKVELAEKLYAELPKALGKFQELVRAIRKQIGKE